MKSELNEKLLAYLTLVSGLAISAVAEYYSILGLTTIFSAAVIPVIIMGIALGVGKIIGTLWLKQNWNIAPLPIKIYLVGAIGILMFITSMGIFGFLSKAHSDQSLVSGDVQSKIAVYDEKIKVAKENIDANRKALKQMDEAVDQTMGRSTTEQGAERAVQIRRSQQRERVRLAQDIEAEQKKISQLMEERAPIAAEVRKVAAEVGPLKYIAAFVYGETDQTILEKAVTWVIIIIVFVFDPLALVLLLASQYSFQNFRNSKEVQPTTDVEKIAEGDSPSGTDPDIVNSATTVTNLITPVHNLETHPYLSQGFKYPPNWTKEPHIVSKIVEAEKESDPHPDRIEQLIGDLESNVEKLYHQNDSDLNKQEQKFDWSLVPPNSEYVDVNGERMSVKVALEKFPLNPSSGKLFVQNEEQSESNIWTNSRKT
jgi:hypothetical protein